MSKPSLDTAFHANPLVNQTVVALQDALQPFVNELSENPSFISMGIFTADKHASSADTLVTIQNKALSPAKAAFNRNYIHNHKVGLQSSVLGRAFRSGKTGLVRSKMNPKQHIVWGVPIMTRTSRAAVAELAFDIEYSNVLPSEIFIESLWRQSENPVRNILEAIPQTGMPLGDELLLHVPVTPSHFIIQWDITNSTKMVDTNYPVFKHFMQTLMLAIETEIDAKQTIVRFMGDGQTLALSMSAIDQLDPLAIKEYGNTVALRLVHTILRLHKTTAKRYSNVMDFKIRIALGLGHLDYIQMTEPTGPVLWELADLLRRADRQNNSLLLTEGARNALQLS